MFPSNTGYYENNGKLYPKTPEYLERKRMNQQAYRERQKKANQAEITLWVHKSNVQKLRDFAKTLVAAPKNKNKTARK
jgi:hypothetical protein